MYTPSIHRGSEIVLPRTPSGPFVCFLSMNYKQELLTFSIATARSWVLYPLSSFGQHSFWCLWRLFWAFNYCVVCWSLGLLAFHVLPAIKVFLGLEPNPTHTMPDLTCFLMCSEGQGTLVLICKGISRLPRLQEGKPHYSLCFYYFLWVPRKSTHPFGVSLASYKRSLCRSLATFDSQIQLALSPLDLFPAQVRGASAPA